MKVVLFCGGLGLRLQEASTRVPKPLIPVGDRPILLHLMKYYAYYRHTDFILCLGHRADAFKEYFLNYNEALQNDFVLAHGGRDIEILKRDIEDWRITFVDTGRKSNIGERLRLVREHLDGEEYFLANYGDVLTDSPLDERIENLKRQDKVASMLCVKPTISAHRVAIGDDGHVSGIGTMDDGSLWINGGFHVFRQDIFDYLYKGEELVEEPFRRLIGARQLIADRYDGFWAPMDTLKDKNVLDSLADTEVPPWAVWLKDSDEAMQTAAVKPRGVH
jgi:glucose-1-phosphate cytidylyltransferase